ncbi:MAG: ABC transporter ATP-binding protein [Proteobacteria bacterium]|nr:ABC transporter ATP-binding protein [Pseudomonadota bacterium]
MARITLENIGFHYPGAVQDTLSGLNLEIANGEAHALLGASGAGKTTLLNLLSGLLSPTAGKLLFDGQDVSQLAGHARNVAQVFQFPVLYESLSVAENLAFPLKSRGVAASQIAERVDYICDELAISPLREHKPGALSLFEKQLVAVGKALVRADLSLVLLDEPLTAVEPRIKWRLRQTLRKVQEDLGVTMIYVTHDQTEALTFADRVSVLTAGGILQTGTPAEIYETPGHEFVGHFVGSPGMNFVPNSALNVSMGERLGFRPEWAVIDESGPVQGVVTRTRVQRTHDSIPYGLVTLATLHGELSVRGATDIEVGTNTALRVHRYVAFADQQKVGEGELV